MDKLTAEEKKNCFVKRSMLDRSILWQRQQRYREREALREFLDEGDEVGVARGVSHEGAAP